MLKRLFDWCTRKGAAQVLVSPCELTTPEEMLLAVEGGLPASYQADRWLRFMLLGEVAQGHTLQGILGFNAIEYDTAHDFIQWLFPNRQPSPVNWEAPLLIDLHVEAYAQLPALREAVDSALAGFLGFLGIEEGPKGLINGHNFDKGSRYWLCPLDHNHRRISRVLTFLCEMGRVNRAEQWLRYLVAAMSVQQLQDVTAVKFWLSIVAAYR